MRWNHCGSTEYIIIQPDCGFDVDLLWFEMGEAIHHVFLPALTGQPTFNLKVREVLSLPVHLGGLGISIPSKSASSEFSTSEKVTASLSDTYH